jgi:hypothetical protein
VEVKASLGLSGAKGSAGTKAIAERPLANILSAAQAIVAQAIGANN